MAREFDDKHPNIQTSVFVALLTRGKLKQAFIVVALYMWDNSPSKLYK